VAFCPSGILSGGIIFHDILSGHHMPCAVSFQLFKFGKASTNLFEYEN